MLVGPALFLPQTLAVGAVAAYPRSARAALTGRGQQAGLAAIAIWHRREPGSTGGRRRNTLGVGLVVGLLTGWTADLARSRGSRLPRWAALATDDDGAVATRWHHLAVLLPCGIRRLPRRTTETAPGYLVTVAAAAHWRRYLSLRAAEAARLFARSPARCRRHALVVVRAARFLTVGAAQAAWRHLVGKTAGALGSRSIPA